MILYHIAFSYMYANNVLVRTTGLAGGLLSPYKGLLPACARKGALKGLPTAPHTQPPLKGAFSVLPYSGAAP